MKLENRIAVVTGAGSGIGRGVAKRFAEEGAKLVLADVNNDGLKQTGEIVAELGGECATVIADVTKKSDVQGLVDKAVETYGTLDIMVNNAGILSWSPVQDMPEEEWDRVLGVNLKGTFLGIQAAAKYWVDNGKPGKIVNTCSINAMVALPAQSHYCASKGGVLMLTKSAAIDLAGYKINVNCIAPGGTRTNIDPGLADPRAAEGAGRGVPWGRIAEPEDQANGVVFLASDDADYITGQMLVIDGGTSTHMAVIAGQQLQMIQQMAAQQMAAQQE